MVKREREKVFRFQIDLANDMFWDATKRFIHDWNIKFYFLGIVTAASVVRTAVQSYAAGISLEKQKEGT